MNQRLNAAAVAAALLFTIAGCARKEAAPAAAPASAPAAAAATGEPCKLNLFIWSEYIDPEIVANFEKEFSCKVTIDLYEDNESMMSKLQGGGTSLYDIVVPGQYLIPVMAKLGLLAELRHENIPNLANLDEKFVNPVFDPGNKYSAAYQWGTVGIYLRKKAGKEVKPAVQTSACADPGPFTMAVATAAPAARAAAKPAAPAKK